MNMKKNACSFPKEKYINLTKINLFRSVFATAYCFHLFLILFVYYFFPESNLKVEGVVVIFGVLLLCLIFDFSFLKSLCLVDDKYAFYLKIFILISVLQGAINFLGSWDSSWRYISAALGMIYCFIFTFYTLSVFDRLMKS